jgi:uncharacterized protein YndB with AHSA1/START domain
VWDALTTPALIKQWFFGVDTETDWVEGHPIVHRGEYQGVAYEDRGIIVRTRKPELLVHTHWSSVSGLSDAPEHYQEVTWSLADHQGQTEVTVSEVNLPSADAKAVSEKAWSGALAALKRTIEA